MHPLRILVRRYDWFHTGVGVVGNLLFVVGSVLFLWESTKHAGVWIFVVGSTCMFVGSAGRAIVDLDRSRAQASRGDGGDRTAAASSRT